MITRSREELDLTDARSVGDFFEQEKPEYVLLAAGRVVCPLHAYRFDLTTGECDDSSTCHVQTFPARVQNGVVMLRLT